MKKFLKVYDLMQKKYGAQKWWPTTLKGNFHPTYHGKKLNDEARFEIIVGAILTQNTSWKNVEKAIIELNKNKILSIKGILKTPVKKLAKIIRSAGYYNQKAERLKIMASFLEKNTIKSLMKKNIDDLRQILLNVKGIGPETADSILLYAFEKPIFVIDTYTKRLFSRLGFCKENISYHDLQNLFMKNLRKNVTSFKEYHALIVEHAKNFCKNRPFCEGCILKNTCAFQ